MQLVRATLAQLLGYACHVVRLRVSDLAVTVSVRFYGGRFDSFLRFEYVVLITLASHVFEYFLRFLLQACVICAFWLRWGSHGVTPYFLATPHVFLTCGPFLGFLGFFHVGQSCSCVGVDRHDDYSDDLLLALRSAALLISYLKGSQSHLQNNGRAWYITKLTNNGITVYLVCSVRHYIRRMQQLRPACTLHCLSWWLLKEIIWITFLCAAGCFQLGL